MILTISPKDVSLPYLGLGLGSLFNFGHKLTFIIDMILQ